jgi:hypothetical protein
MRDDPPKLWRAGGSSLGAWSAPIVDGRYRCGRGRTFAARWRADLSCVWGGMLAPWGHARWRSSRLKVGAVRYRPRRGCCTGCAKTHVLLPAAWLLRRADAASVIGSALLAKAAGQGHRSIAAALGRPASTVRGGGCAGSACGLSRCVCCSPCCCFALIRRLVRCCRGSRCAPTRWRLWAELARQGSAGSGLARRGSSRRGLVPVCCWRPPVGW